MYVTMFCFSIDAAGIAAITGSIAHLLSDGSFTFSCIIVTFEISSKILSASFSQFAEVL